MTTACLDLADRLIAAGFSVYLPLFFGEPGQHSVPLGFLATTKLCLRKELNAFTKDGPQPAHRLATRALP